MATPIEAYVDFLRGKAQITKPSGFEIALSDLNPHLFDFQKDIVRWALRSGKSAVFADTGLGKTRMQLEWARRIVEHEGGDVLILAPLAVAPQTVAEGNRIGVEVRYRRHQEQVDSPITITNYEMLDSFDTDHFIGVVLDESSRIKSYDSKTRDQVIGQFHKTPYKLACTATPAPNDYMELGNHSEFLGTMTRSEMLSMYFVHDGGDTNKWRLKGHAEIDFWRWVAGWAVAVRKPSDLGYSNDGYDLPTLDIREHIVDTETPPEQGQTSMFYEARTLTEQRQARRSSLAERVKMTADLVIAEPNEPWVIWCDLNDESEALTAAIPGAVEVKGSDSISHKESAMTGFSNGDIRVMVSKPSICGFGMNWQHCARTAFVGVSHSFEMTYQAIRRFWRFGQDRQVVVHFIYGESESAVARNLRRKEADAYAMQEKMIAHMREINALGLQFNQRLATTYQPATTMEVPRWL